MSSQCIVKQFLLSLTLLGFTGCGGKNFDLPKDIEIQTDLLKPIIAVEVSSKATQKAAKNFWKNEKNNPTHRLSRDIGYNLPITSSVKGEAQKIARGTYESTSPKNYPDRDPILGVPMYHAGRPIGHNRGEPANIIITIAKYNNIELAIEFLAQDVLSLISAGVTGANAKNPTGRLILFERGNYESDRYTAHALWDGKELNSETMDAFREKLKALLKLKKEDSINADRIREFMNTLDAIERKELKIFPKLRLEPSHESHVIRLFIDT